MAADSKRLAQLVEWARARVALLSLYSYDVMDSVGSMLNFYLHGPKAQQKFHSNPSDHVGVFEHSQLEKVSYRDLLLQIVRLQRLIKDRKINPSSVAKESEVYDTYLRIAEEEYKESFINRCVGWAHLFRPELIRDELLEYIISERPSSGRNEIAHIFSKSFESDQRQGLNGYSFWELKDSPTARARQPDVKKRLLDVIDELSQVDKLPDSVKAFATKFKTCFAMQLGFLRSVLEESGKKKAKPADVAQLKAPLQPGVMNWASVVKKDRILAKPIC